MDCVCSSVLNLSLALVCHGLTFVIWEVIMLLPGVFLLCDLLVYNVNAVQDFNT